MSETASLSTLSPKIRLARCGSTWVVCGVWAGTGGGRAGEANGLSEDGAAQRGCARWSSGAGAHLERGEGGERSDRVDGGDQAGEAT